MTHPSGGAKPGAADRRGIPAGSRPTFRPRPSALDVVPIGPNVFATLASFLFLIGAPWICLHTLEAVWEDAIGEDLVANYLILTNLEETFINAGVGAALFLVIGVILQTWQHQRPFPPRVPILLAFPIAWVLLMPEVLVGGGSVLSGAIVGTTIGLAFGVHWGLLTILSEAME